MCANARIAYLKTERAAVLERLAAGNLTAAMRRQLTKELAGLESRLSIYTEDDTPTAEEEVGQTRQRTLQ
jgi:hypothetical protein